MTSIPRNRDAGLCGSSPTKRNDGCRHIRCTNEPDVGGEQTPLGLLIPSHDHVVTDCDVAAAVHCVVNSQFLLIFIASDQLFSKVVHCQ